MTRLAALRIRAGLRVGLCALALAVAAGCGNDPDREGTFALAQSAAATALGPLLGEGASEPAASTPATLAPILAQLPPGPVLRVEVLKLEQSVLAYTAATNGPYRTFATVSAQTLTLRAGVVTATRGFAWDLMSSSTNGAAEVIRRRGSGTVQRIYRHLSAMDDEEERVATCTIAPQASEAVTVASGTRFSTTRMREACTAQDLSFTNLYWVTSGGAIVRSEQWISDEVGTFRIERLRG